MLKTNELFDTEHTIAGWAFENAVYPFEILSRIGEIITETVNMLGDNYTEISAGVFAAADARISESATVIAPAIIDNGAEIRPGAYIRGNAIIGKGAVIGNSSEIKNSIIFDGAQLPHYNYAGDSIIGYKAHMGAGVIASNLRLDKKNIMIRDGGKLFDTGLRKLGSMLGDHCEIGCNSVLYPGCVIGRECLIYPLSRVRGVIPEKSILIADGIMKKRLE